MPKRTEAQIIQDIQNVECALSPENISWDGERSRAEVSRARTALMSERAALVKELGREPTDREVYPY